MDENFIVIKKPAIILKDFLLSFRISKLKLKIFFRLEDVAFQSYIYDFQVFRICDDVTIVYSA